jgi:hypothetical protein
LAARFNSKRLKRALSTEISKKQNPLSRVNALSKRLCVIPAHYPYILPINIFNAQPNLIALLVMFLCVLFLLTSSVAVFRGEAYLLS